MTYDHNITRDAGTQAAGECDLDYFEDHPRVMQFWRAFYPDEEIDEDLLAQAPPNALFFVWLKRLVLPMWGTRYPIFYFASQHCTSQEAWDEGAGPRSRKALAHVMARDGTVVGYLRAGARRWTLCEPSREGEVAS
jgi:hypothetical protein